MHANVPISSVTMMDILFRCTCPRKKMLDSREYPVVTLWKQKAKQDGSKHPDKLILYRLLCSLWQTHSSNFL